MKVSFCGTRGSISTPGRATEKYGGNTPCVSVRHGDTVVILDAGTGIRGLGLDLAQEYRDHPHDLDLHLFLSHTHWDHIQGLPFFQPAYMKGVRLSIYGHASKKGVLKRILRGQMEFDYFPVDMSFMSCDLQIHELSEHELQIGDFALSWQEQVYHPGGSIRYRLRRGGSTMVYATDVELNKCFTPEATEDDARQIDIYKEFVHGVDLLIADGAYTEEEYPSFINFGHTTIPLIVDIAYQARVKQLAVFHHEPQHGDSILDELFLKYHAQYYAMDPPMNVFWAREGVTVPL